MSKINILIIYGLPCSGKSSVLKSIGNNGYHGIAVDSIIKNIVTDPSLSDFSRFSTEIIENIINEINANKYVIEMGYLIPKKSIY